MMEPMKSKAKGLFSMAKKNSVGGRGDMNVEELEIRPGGMLVQKRDSNSKPSSVPIPSIKVRVKYGSSYYEIRISSQASFGELKKMLAEHTGLHHEDQKLIYKNKERDSKAYLDVARVKDGSKIVLIDDIASRERRCLEMLKNAKIEKASNIIAQISLEVDKLAGQVTALETAASRGGKVVEMDLDNLTGILMTKLVKLDEIVVDGDLKLQKRMQERRAQKFIETLDMLKLHNSKPSSNGEKITSRQQENSIGQMPMPKQKQQVQPKHRNLTEKLPVLPQPLRHSESVVVTTKWETFD